MPILGTELTSTLSTKGESPNNLDKLQTSTLHNEYSLNGKPHMNGLPLPSQLDDAPLLPYTQNKPE